MSFADKLQAELQAVISPCTQDIYRGSADEYVVFSIAETPAAFGDDTAILTGLLVSVSWCYPWAPGVKKTASWREKKKSLAAAIQRTGCTAPSVTEAGDYEWGRLVYESRYMEVPDGP